jgi:hypothetical protein
MVKRWESTVLSYIWRKQVEIMPKNSKKIIVSTEELRQFLVNNQISQTKASDLCSVTPRTFRRWVSGKTPMPNGAWELLQIKIRLLHQI